MRAWLCGALVGLGCAAPSTPVTKPPVIELEAKPAPTPPRCDAADVLRSALALPLEVTVDVAALRASPDIAELGRFLETIWVFRSTPIDPFEHFDLTFLVGPGATADRRSYFFVAQHQLPAEQVRDAFEAIAQKRQTEPVADLAVPALRILPTAAGILHRAKPLLVVAVSPTLVVVASEPYLGTVAKIIGCDRLTPVAHGVLVQAVARRPGAALAGLKLPQLPPAVERVDARAVTNPGGVEVVIEAPTPSEADASALAERVDRELDDAGGQLLPLPDFHAEGSVLVGRRILSPGETLLLGTAIRLFSDER
jgi:hypothetical protein